MEEKEVTAESPSGAQDVIQSLPRKILDYVLVTAVVGGATLLLKAAFVIPVVSVGEPFDIDSFKYTVTDLECGLETLGEGSSTTTAQGDYCKIDFQSANTSNVNGRPFHDWTLVLANGQRFNADSQWDGFFMKDIFPGNFTEGMVAFDIPENSQPDHLYLEGEVKFPFPIRDRVNVSL